VLGVCAIFIQQNSTDPENCSFRWECFWISFQRALEDAKAAREEVQRDRIMLMQALQNSMNNNNNNKRPAKQALKNTAKRAAAPPLVAAARKLPPTRKVPRRYDTDSSSSTDVFISD